MMVLSACSVPNISNVQGLHGASDSKAMCEQRSQRLYEAHLKPKLVAAGCGSCHTEMSAPLYLSKDAKKAFQHIKPKVNLQNPEKSVVVQQQASMHNCKESCGDNVTAFKEAISIWGNVLVSAGCVHKDSKSMSKASADSSGDGGDGGNESKSEMGVAAIFDAACKSCHAGEYDGSSLTDSVLTNKQLIINRIKGIGNVMPPPSNSWPDAGSKDKVLEWLEKQ